MVSFQRFYNPIGVRKLHREYLKLFSVPSQTSDQKFTRWKLIFPSSSIEVLFIINVIIQYRTFIKVYIFV